MKITSDKIEISPNEIVFWQDVKTMRLINNKLSLIMKDGRVIEFQDIRPTTVDLAFRSYEQFLNKAPHKRNSSPGD